MAISMSRTGGTLTVTVTVDVSDLVAAVGISNADKKAQAMRRALDQLAAGVRALGLSDADLDQQAADASTLAASLKAARPSGTF
jgi:hypothetical protein